LTTEGGTMTRAEYEGLNDAGVAWFEVDAALAGLTKADAKALAVEALGFCPASWTRGEAVRQLAKAMHDRRESRERVAEIMAI
jgi:hypothetical protein